MSKRTKFLLTGLVVALVAAALVGWAVAQVQSPSQQTTTFLGKVAANLGVTEERLSEAITQARLQLIDEAVAQGWITQQQADWMKQQIEGSQAMLQMIDEALQQGKITQEQAEWMKQRLLGRGLIGMGWGPWGSYGRGWGPGLGGKAGFSPPWGWRGRGWGGCP